MTQITVQSKKPVGRNGPCPCGSQKKYKRCCLVGKSLGLKRINGMTDKQANLARKVQQGEKEAFSLTKSMIICNPVGFEKMSEVLIEFAMPALEEARTFEAQCKIIGMAANVWNVSFLPDAERAKVIQKIANTVESNAGEEDVQKIQIIFLKLLQRKDAYFSNHTRTIVDCQCSLKNGSLYVDVVSSLPKNLDQAELDALKDSMINAM